MRRLSAVVLVTLALLAVACGDDDTDSTAEGAASSSTTETPSTTEAPTTTSSTTPASTTEAPSTTLAPIPVPEATDVASLLALERPIVAAHAGGDQAWPKSTMYAFAEAARGGTDVLEMDVQLTGDGTLVVIHDDTVDGTTGSSGRVRDLTYDELQALDQAYWWSEAWASRDEPDDAYVYRGMRTGEVEPPPGYGPDDFRVETFRAVAEAFPDHVLDVEIKRPDGDDGETDMEFTIEGARVLAEEIEALGRTDSVVVVSFEAAVMEAFRELAPDVVTSPATTEVYSWLVGSAELAPSDRILQLPPSYEGIPLLTDELLARAADEGLTVWVWPNSKDQENADFYEEMVADVGVAGVIAGDPNAAVERFATLG